jgi:hypothetical protein
MLKQKALKKIVQAKMKDCMDTQKVSALLTILIQIFKLSKCDIFAEQKISFMN